jgi:hypothetical protein
LGSCLRRYSSTPLGPLLYIFFLHYNQQRSFYHVTLNVFWGEVFINTTWTSSVYFFPPLPSAVVILPRDVKRVLGRGLRRYLWTLPVQLLVFLII